MILPDQMSPARDFFIKFPPCDLTLIDKLIVVANVMPQDGSPATSG